MECYTEVWPRYAELFQYTALPKTCVCKILYTVQLNSEINIYTGDSQTVRRGAPGRTVWAPRPGLFQNIVFFFQFMRIILSNVY